MSCGPYASTSANSTSQNPRSNDSAQEEPQQVSVAAALGESINVLVQKTLKELELRDLDIRSRTKSLVEKERKFQQREQLLVDKERAIESKERSISDREKKIVKEEKSLQDERKRHTDHVKSSLASLQQQKQESTKEIDQRIAALQQNYAEAAAERDALRDQVTQQSQGEHSKDGPDGVQLHTSEERPPEHWNRYYNAQQPYEADPDHEEEPPPQHAPFYPPVHHMPYPIPQQYHPHFKYPPLPARGYGYQPYFPMRGYAPGIYPPPGVFPPRNVEPRSEPSGEEENGENPQWRDPGYAPQANQEEEHQERQRSHLANYPGQPQYPPVFWGADSQN